MVDTTALVGSARVGTALVGSLGTAPPPRLRVHGACWELVADQAAIDAAKAHTADREQAVRDDLALLAQEKADAAKQAAIDAATEAATTADEALEAALGEMVEGKSNVFIQDVPPVEAMQRQGVLWIDTTPVTLADGTTAPGHTPKTWDPTTSAWVAVTDSVALEAARAAAAAHEAAEAAADAAGTAMSEARYAPRIADRIPTPADGEGKPAGAGWWQYDPTSQLLVQGWRWTGAAWVRLDMDPTIIPVLDIGTGTFGDLDGDRLTVTGALSARVVDAMSVNAKKLVVTDEAILNHATLIGQTVVDDINVQGKLIGTDGVFTGTVDFENVNVTGELLAQEISGEYLYGTVIEGGEIRTGSDETRGSFLLGDKAYVSPLDGYTSPGIQFAFPGAARRYPAGIGIDANAVAISGGRRADDAYARLNVGAGSVSMASSPPANDPLGWGSRLNVSKDVLQLLSGLPDQSEAVEVMASGPLYAGGTAVSHAQVRLSVKHGGKRAQIQAMDGVSTVESSDGTTKRSLSVDDSGVWVKRWRNDGSGQPDNFNLLGDDWGVVTLGSEWSPRTSGGYYGGLRVRRLGGSVEINGAVQGGSSGSKIGTIADPQLRPKYDTFVVTTLAAGGLGQAFVGSNGDIMHSYGPSRPAFLAINVSVPVN